MSTQPSNAELVRQLIQKFDLPQTQAREIVSLASGAARAKEAAQDDSLMGQLVSEFFKSSASKTGGRKADPVNMLADVIAERFGLPKTKVRQILKFLAPFILFFFP